MILKRLIILLLACISVSVGARGGWGQTSPQSKQGKPLPASDDLMTACAQGDAQQVEALLKQGANINARGQSKMTPLMTASLLGHIEIVKLLIARGAEVNASNATGLTALHLAAGRGSDDCVRYLLQKGAKINASDRHGTTPLGMAQQMLHPETAQLLIKAGAKVPNTVVNVAPNAPKDQMDRGGVPAQVIQPYLEKAKRTYPAAKKRFLAGLPTGQSFFITTTLVDAAHHHERVFVGVRSIEKGMVHGVIANDIELVTGYKNGDPYTFPESAMLDWTISHPDGKEEGNVVGNFIESYQKLHR